MKDPDVFPDGCRVDVCNAATVKDEQETTPPLDGLYVHTCEALLIVKADPIAKFVMEYLPGHER